MVVFPNAKINLGLNVLSKREDGYHEIATPMVPVDFCDILEVMEGKKFSFECSGVETGEGDADNLCVKAFRLLQKDFDLPEVQMYLHKQIPVGAGLGGGSSDAAFVLKAVNEIFQLFLDESILEDYASRLGSDCPFFIQNKPAIATGRGEQLEPVPLSFSGKKVLLVYPDIAVGTAEAYQGIQPAEPELPVMQIIRSFPLEQWHQYLRNDFEHTIFSKYPEIQAIKDRLYENGALYAGMSGSGSAVYGIFNESTLPDHVDSLFPKEYMVWKGEILG